MITINLVPQEHKIKIERKKTYLAIKEALLIILLFASVISIMLMLSKSYLESQLADLMNENSQNVAMIQKTNDRIKSINEKINDADSVQKNFKSWSGLITALYSAKGEDISYSYLKIFRKESTVEISGVSKTRDALLLLQKNLQKMDYFKKINLPLSNLISKENNSFSIKIDLDLTKTP